MPLATKTAKPETLLASEQCEWRSLLPATQAPRRDSSPLAVGIAKVGFGVKPGFGKWPWLCTSKTVHTALSRLCAFST